MKKILVMGSLNMDLVTNVNITPKVGETVLGKGFSEIPGGKGANQAAAMGKLKGDVKMLGKVGEDNFGQILKENLEKVGVNASNVFFQKKQSTGIAMIMVNGNGDNSIVVIPGANFDLMPQDVDEAILSECDFLVAQLEVPMKTVEAAFSRGRELGKYTILNPAPAQELNEELLKNVNLLIPNETELELLSGIEIKDFQDVMKAAKIMINKGIDEIIVTLGEKGALYFNGKEYKEFSAYNVKAVDTTAAGDSFIAGLTVKLAQNKTIEEAIEYATKISAITVTRKGAQSSLPSLEEVNNFKGVKR